MPDVLPVTAVVNDPVVPLVPVLAPIGATPTEREAARQDAVGVAATKATELALVMHGQRQINRIWEVTQAIITISVTLAMVGAAFVMMLGYTAQIPSELTNAFFMVLAFYLQRTNHTAKGGVGVGETGR